MDLDLLERAQMTSEVAAHAASEWSLLHGKCEKIYSKDRDALEVTR